MALYSITLANDLTTIHKITTSYNVLDNTSEAVLNNPSDLLNLFHFHFDIAIQQFSRAGVLPLSFQELHHLS